MWWQPGTVLQALRQHLARPINNKKAIENPEASGGTGKGQFPTCVHTRRGGEAVREECCNPEVSLSHTFGLRRKKNQSSSKREKIGRIT